MTKNEYDLTSAVLDAEIRMQGQFTRLLSQDRGGTIGQWQDAMAALDRLQAKRAGLEQAMQVP